MLVRDERRLSPADEAGRDALAGTSEFGLARAGPGAQQREEFR